ncbi:APC family amino acid-polyamine-organocation transporter [Limosilactobacillus frumenti DSM 13145]|uniref:APC family amino acid-polyamine-organocation transporter n=1 Tax=Limosilactobacillus frumenti DSM 13145 TaxID=1423746 RepID=A0A0R1PHL9_9LACO|nr:APC family permease [Limosilactobacillus frumenti]KRL28395.1 APC family amino acid-polyamine-organocation transporter [Limosilactobacillus frumenti DSM 13145]QFG72185.1 APC family permease [Limosilactobacillus frumenti]
MDKLKQHKITLFSGIMLALNSLIGSGWLFGAGTAAKVAGPAAIISWVIGAVIIIVIALTYVELGAMFPQSGGMSRYAQYSHGPFLGFIAAWANWVSLITLVPMEAVASVQYMSSWPWSWANWTHQFMKNGNVTTAGLWVVFLFMLIFTLINFWSVKLMTRFTNLISIFKVVLPSLTILMLLISGFHPANFGHSMNTFMPYGSRSIFEAAAVSGIIMSYDAFQTIINMGGEMVNPKKNIPRGVIISMLITAAIYIMLQIAFIGAVSPSLLAVHGWHGINFTSPFADIAMLLSLNWLAILLYMDAFVSPFGTGVAFVATASRALAAMTHTGHLPQWLGRLQRRYMIPRFAMIADLAFATLILNTFRNWSLLATVITGATLIAYLTGPVTVMSLRTMAPDLERPFQPNYMKWLAPVAFVLTGLAIYWTMWPTTIQVILVILIGLPVYLYYEMRYHHSDWKKQFRSASWLIAYMIFMAAISYIGSEGFGGRNWLPYPWDFVVIVIVSLLFYVWALHSHTAKVDPDAYKINHRVQRDAEQFDHEHHPGA